MSNFSALYMPESIAADPIAAATWQGLEGGRCQAHHIDEIWKAAIDTSNVTGVPLSAEQIINKIGDTVLIWWDALRSALVEDYLDSSEYGPGDLVTHKWDDIPGYKAGKVSWSSFRQALGRRTGGATFEISGRVKVANFYLEGARNKLIHVGPKKRPNGEPNPKKRPAAGKGEGKGRNFSKGKGKGKAPAPAPAPAFSDKGEARALLLQILTEYPEMVSYKSVRGAIDKAEKSIISAKLAKQEKKVAA